MTGGRSLESSGVFGAVVVLVLAGWGATRLTGPDGTAPDHADGRDRPEVAVAVDATVDPFALPLHLPVALPPGVTWVGETQRDLRDGELVAVTTAFQAPDGAVVGLCAAAATDADRCRERDGGPTAGEVERAVGEHVVLLRPVSGTFASAAEARFWETVELTGEPARVSWLD